MAVKVTIVHGPDDEVTKTLATQGGALAWAVIHENERHDTKEKPLSSFFDWVSPDRNQYGTDYHYVIFEDLTDAPCRMCLRPECRGGCLD